MDKNVTIGPKWPGRAVVAVVRCDITRLVGDDIVDQLKQNPIWAVLAQVGYNERPQPFGWPGWSPYFYLF
jgi:hypothetical protein